MQAYGQHISGKQAMVFHVFHVTESHWYNQKTMERMACGFEPTVSGSVVQHSKPRASPTAKLLEINLYLYCISHHHIFGKPRLHGFDSCTKCEFRCIRKLSIVNKRQLNSDSTVMRSTEYSFEHREFMWHYQKIQNWCADIVANVP